jgi:hypothetical protein
LSWTEPLRDACFAALKARGNTTRQALVQEFCAKQIQEDKSLRRWATFTGYSGLHAYWYATDLVAARRLLRLRLDVGPNEDNIRRMQEDNASLQNQVGALSNKATDLTTSEQQIKQRAQRASPSSSPNARR